MFLSKLGVQTSIHSFIAKVFLRHSFGINLLVLCDVIECTCYYLYWEREPVAERHLHTHSKLERSVLHEITLNPLKHQSAFKLTFECIIFKQVSPL